MLQVLNHIGKQLRKDYNLDLYDVLLFNEFAISKDKKQTSEKPLTIFYCIDISKKNELPIIETKEFSTEDLIFYKAIDHSLWTGNYRTKWLTSLFINKIDVIGKISDSLYKGQFLKHIKDNLIKKKKKHIEKLGYKVNLENSDFYQILQKLKGHQSLKKETIVNALENNGLLKNASLFVVCVNNINLQIISHSDKCERLINDCHPISKIKGFDDVYKASVISYFIDEKLGILKNNDNAISYITQGKDSVLIPAIFPYRVNINKIFVTTTINFASNFNSNEYVKNYALTLEEAINITYASKYLLNKQTFKIAETSHYFVPKILPKLLTEDFDLLGNLETLKKSNELIFQDSEMLTFEKSLSIEIDKELPIWLDYYGYESDGTNIKVINVINDVLPSRLTLIIKTLDEITSQYGKFLNVENFNLYSIFKFIPIRIDKKTKKPKDKVNIALKIFKNVFEDAQINKNDIYQLAAETFSAFKYKRTDNYLNFKKIEEQEDFDINTKKAIKNYLLFIKFLQNLKLMENTKYSPTKFDQQIFEKFNFTDDYKAMYYLGRLLYEIAEAQKDSGHETKPILNKLNYSGMYVDHIIRLANELFEKTRQYSTKIKLENAEKNFALFRYFFNQNNFKLTPEEALFYILTGYSLVKLN